MVSLWFTVEFCFFYRCLPFLASLLFIIQKYSQKEKSYPPHNLNIFYLIFLLLFYLRLPVF